MNVVSTRGLGWPRGRWWGVIGLVLFVQVGLIYWLGERSGKELRRAATGPQLRVVEPGPSQLLALTDGQLRRWGVGVEREAGAEGGVGLLGLAHLGVDDALEQADPREIGRDHVAGHFLLPARADKIGNVTVSLRLGIFEILTPAFVLHQQHAGPKEVDAVVAERGGLRRRIRRISAPPSGPP